MKIEFRNSNIPFNFNVEFASPNQRVIYVLFTMLDYIRERKFINWLGRGIGFENEAL